MDVDADKKLESLKPSDVVLFTEKGRPKIPCVVIKILNKQVPELVHCLFLLGDTCMCKSVPRSSLMPFVMCFPETELCFEVRKHNLDLRRSFRLALDIKLRKIDCTNYFECKCERNFTVPLKY